MMGVGGGLEEEPLLGRPGEGDEKSLAGRSGNTFGRLKRRGEKRGREEEEGRGGRTRPPLPR